LSLSEFAISISSRCCAVGFPLSAAASRGVLAREGAILDRRRKAAGEDALVFSKTPMVKPRLTVLAAPHEVLRHLLFREPAKGK
jgi:hypothetical protein